MNHPLAKHEIGVSLWVDDSPDSDYQLVPDYSFFLTSVT